MAPPQRQTPAFQPWIGALLVAGTTLALAWALAPELVIGRIPLNDVVFHRAASERMALALARREPFLDAWVSEWSLGYPVWRSYAPLPHLLGALVITVARPVADPATTFAALVYGLIVLLPVTTYLASRRLGLAPVAAGLAAALLPALSGAGDLDRYGIGLGSQLWRGSGLYAQLVALHLLLFTLAAVRRALDDGERRGTAAALLAATTLAHVIFGYVAFVSAAAIAVVGPEGRRSRRLVSLASITGPALLALAWFVVPLVLAGPSVHHSRWEAPEKWDSYGAAFVLRSLAAGRLLDAGREPVLTWLLALGTAGALLARDHLARRLLALAAVWLTLYFGRETWGHLVVLAGVPGDLHLHRLQGAFELAAVLLASFGLAWLVARLGQMHRLLGVAGALALAVAIGSLASDRGRYLAQGAAWGHEAATAFDRERVELDAALQDVKALLAERPGRVSAGLAATWGRAFKIGSIPVYTFLTREHLDEVSFLFHAMSATSDLMVVRDEGSAAHDDVFGIRAVLAPAERPMPPHLRRRSVHGRFAVYEASSQGYFGLVDVAGRYDGPRSAEFDESSAWLSSWLPRAGLVVALDRPAVAAVPGQWQASRGRIVAESKEGETYRARVQLDRPAHVLLKITWHPDLVARVDGGDAPLLRVTPGFGAVAVPAGVHDVVVRYQPGLLKPVLLVAGLGLLIAAARLLRRPGYIRREEAVAGRLAAWAERVASPRRVAAVAVLLAALVALHPLFRGQLVDGHDALEYPPRLSELQRVVAEGHLPPVWAPDLGAGNGQPLFEFAPPLVYAAALPLRYLGLGLADSLQLALALLHLCGAAAMYRIGRHLGATRAASAGGAITWLFAPYVALDLFVRAAYAEASAVAVAPIALLGVLRAVERRTAGSVVAAAAAVALVVLGHNGAALLLLPGLAATVLLGAWAARDRGGGAAAPVVRGGVAGAAALVLGLALSAWFWIPALLEKQLVHVERLREGFLHWSEHAVVPWQLLWSPWGHGLSVPGTGDGMSFALGPVHLALAGAGLVIALRGGDRRRRVLAAGFAALALTGAFLSTTWAAPVWERAPVLQYLAYPWRSLLVPALFLPVLATLALDAAGHRWTVALVGLVVLLGIPHTEPKRFVLVSDAFYAPPSIAENAVRTATREEYDPRWVERPTTYERRVAIGVAAPVEARELSRGAVRRELAITATADTAVDLPLSFYPGWAVTVDGAAVESRPAPGTGALRFELRRGAHQVLAELRPTPVRRGALLASGLALAAVVAVACGSLVGTFRRRRGRRASSGPSPGESPGPDAREAPRPISARGTRPSPPVGR